MESSEDRQHEAATDPEMVGLVWIGADRAVVVRWTDEPTVEHLASAVPPRRRGVGSVRRGPARPSGGGRVSGHGTEEKHEQESRRFLHPERLAELLRHVAARRNADAIVTIRALSRRPSDNQLKARLRKLVGEELPRRQMGRYRMPGPEPATPTGRPLRPAAGRRTLRPPMLSEQREIDEEVEAMLGEGPWDP